MNDSLLKALKDETDASAPADRLIEYAEPQFRTVSTPRGRAGIRIERVFWEALTSISQALGIKRPQLVATVIERASGGRLNVASALRTYVAMVQRAEIERLGALVETTRIARLLQLAPMPSFALTRQKRLISANTEFVHYLRAASADPTRMVAPDVAQLSLDRPIEQLFDELRSEDASVRCTLTIRVDDRHRRVPCKVVAVPPLPAQAIVGYVLS